MRTPQNHNPRGAAMLIAVLVLTTIMLGFAIVASTTARINSSSLVSIENKKLAIAAATSCMEHAIDTLGRSALYTGNETRSVGSLSCTILSVSGSTQFGWTIETSSQVNEANAHLRVLLSSRTPIQITSWDEIVP